MARSFTAKRNLSIGLFVAWTHYSSNNPQQIHRECRWSRFRVQGPRPARLLRLSQKLNQSHPAAIVSRRAIPILRLPASRLNRTSIRFAEPRQIRSHRVRRKLRHLNGQATVVTARPMETLRLRTGALNRFALHPIQRTQVRLPRCIPNHIQLHPNASLMSRRILQLRTRRLQLLSLSTRQLPDTELRRSRPVRTSRILRHNIRPGNSPERTSRSAATFGVVIDGIPVAAPEASTCCTEAGG